jgi:hypothetical protein
VWPPVWPRYEHVRTFLIARFPTLDATTSQQRTSMGLQVDRNLALYLPRLAVLVSIEAESAGKPHYYYRAPHLR